MSHAAWRDVNQAFWTLGLFCLPIHCLSQFLLAEDIEEDIYWIASAEQFQKRRVYYFLLYIYECMGSKSKTS